jgi:hypothetical protein
MAQAETQERTTIGLQKENAVTTSWLELVVNFAWLFGWLGLGVAVVTAFMSPPRIVLQAGGSVLIEGVDFRVVLGSLFLMGFRTVLQGWNWLRRNFKSILR